MAPYGNWLNGVLAELLAKFGPLTLEDGERFQFVFRQNGITEYADALARHLGRRKLNLRSARASLPRPAPSKTGIRAPKSDREKNALLVQLRKESRLKTAIQLARALLFESVKNDALLNLLAISLAEAGNALLAARILEALLEYMPGNHLVLTNLAESLRSLRRLDDALGYVNQALAIKPDHQKAVLVLAGLKMDGGDPLAALELTRKAVAIDPKNVSAIGSLLFLQSYDQGLTPVEQRQTAEIQRASINVGGPYPRPPLSRNASGNLRVGFVSGDFGVHPVGFFMTGFHEHLRKHGISTYLYSTQARNDEINKKFMRNADKFQDIRPNADPAVAEIIRRDKIDVLIDLAGHTAGNRLPVFAFRPAPVQATYLGYFGTTGYPEIDFIIGDATVTPLENAAHFVERIIQVEGSYFCYSPDKVAAKPGPAPYSQNGFITFACFNRPDKVNADVVGAWMTAISRIPDSRLLLRSSKWQNSATLQLVKKGLADHGIPESILQIEGTTSRKGYFDAYNRVDIMLDTFPYMGATTTAEALSMGVPVISLKGNHLFASLGASLLFNAGFPEWVSADSEGYVEAALRTAGEIAKGGLSKQFVRDQVDNSGLFDGEKFAEKFASCIRMMVDIVERETRA